MIHLHDVSRGNKSRQLANQFSNLGFARYLKKYVMWNMLGIFYETSCPKFIKHCEIKIVLIHLASAEPLVCMILRALSCVISLMPLVFYSVF